MRHPRFLCFIIRANIIQLYKKAESIKNPKTMAKSKIPNPNAIRNFFIPEYELIFLGKIIKITIASISIIRSCCQRRFNKVCPFAISRNKSKPDKQSNKITIIILNISKDFLFISMNIFFRLNFIFFRGKQKTKHNKRKAESAKLLSIIYQSGNNKQSARQEKK